ncbi:MAG: glutamate--cysteine ligase [Sodalis sp. Fle]|nr:MAG: glutamate--cysteine ligase [Sodalis sp. Fle]
MIPDVSDALSWLEANPLALKGICRGVERETLRINANGTLAQTPHPKSLGASLTHKWITTDFAESLLEFITPVDNDINHMLTLLRDIHRYVARHISDERMWPFSMPCFIDSAQTIELAQYGSSNLGRMKTLYREGLKNRYSALVQVIAGVHYNFSLPLAFWQAYAGITDEVSGKEEISAGYLQLIRNYYRFGWIIPYLFGASPGIYQSFLNGRQTDLPFEKLPSGFIYLPHATSLRLSNLGYTNNESQSQLGITFNNLDEYVRGLKQAMKTPSADYQRIGLRKNGHYLQLNTNVLQIENELYAPIRPKRVIQDDESLSDALLRGGIEYIEVRSLDINPFSPIGVNEELACFLDSFLIWCALAEAPAMSAQELLCTRSNWNRVILGGRKPGLMLGVDCNSSDQPLVSLGKLLLSDLRRVAGTLDSNNGDSQYQRVCDQLVVSFDQPDLTLSARLLEQIKKYGICRLGMMLANKYRRVLSQEPLEVLSESRFNEEQVFSWQRQRALESADRQSFEAFLASKNE